jgi:signal transduction histidine kinase
LFKTKTTTILSKNNVVMLITIAVIATLLSIFSYHYYTSTSAKIADIASHEIRTNAQIQVHDLSQILSNKFEGINNLLQTLADSPTIHNNEYKRASTVINIRQQYSKQLTDFYMWLDKNGKMNWLSNINQSAYQKYKGIDLSYRLYFSIPRDSHAAYYSTLIESNDKIPRLYISYPVINLTGGKGSPGVLTGLVVASIRATTLGKMLQSQLIPQFNSTIGLLDRNGIVLYSSTPSFIGKYVFGNDIQSALSSLLTSKDKDSLNNLIKRSLLGGTGSSDISVQGKTSTISYEPVNINDKYFLTLYVIAPHDFASDVGLLIDQQKNFSVLIVIIIGVVAFSIAFLTLSWNRRLENTVNIRTAELKNANEQLKVHDKMQREFINIAAHELRTPIQPIIALSDILLHKIRDGESRDLIDVIFRNAKRLQRLSQDILDITKIESGLLKFNKERFNLRQVISNTVDDYRNQIKNSKRNIRLAYGFDKEEISQWEAGGEQEQLHKQLLIQDNDTIFVEADKGRITQVIDNLLSNALKFTNEGTISVSVESKDRQAVVSIKDNGKGIDPSILPKLFTKFASKSDIGGTGLGLFISKSIVEAHGGKIWAENNTNEKGAIFYFSLPLIQSSKH